MILPDVNVLLYAFRQDAEGHFRYRQWLEEVVNAEAAYGVSPQVLSAVVRICTHPGIFRQPSSLGETLAFCRAIMAPRHATFIQPGERHWMIFEEQCASTEASGNLVQDAWYAALAIENGCEWISTDADYARFKALRWRRPF